jgi:hypothetical protein
MPFAGAFGLVSQQLRSNRARFFGLEAASDTDRARHPSGSSVGLTEAFALAV